MDTQKQPGISFDNIILGELSFVRNPTTSGKSGLNIEFENTASFSEDKKKLMFKLSASVNEKEADGSKSTFNLKCQMIGFFSIIDGMQNMSLDEFSKVNAPALMIPYVREIIANITMRSGLKPIILKPINMVSINKEAILDKESALLEKK